MTTSFAEHAIPAPIPQTDQNRQSWGQLIGVTIIRLCAHSIGGLMCLFVAFLVVPLAQEGFVRNELMIAPITVIVINNADWMSSFFHVVLPLYLFIDLAALIGLQSLPRAVRWLSKVWFVGVLLLMIAYLTVVSLAVVIPYASLENSTEVVAE